MIRRLQRIYLGLSQPFGNGSRKPALHASVCWVGHGSHQSSAQTFACPGCNTEIDASLFGGSCLLDGRPFDAGALFAHPGVEHYILERS